MSQWSDLELDRQIIGTLIMCNERLDISLLKADYFVQPVHRTLLEHILLLWQNNKPIDFLTVSGSLKDAGVADYISGDKTMLEMMRFIIDNYVTTAEDGHTLMLRGLWQRRQVERLLNDATTKLDQGTSTKEIIDQFDHSVFHVFEDVGNRTHLDKERELTMSLEAILNPKPDDCIPPPWPSINAMIGGYRAEEMIVFAGRPGMGKTAMMCTAQLELAKVGIASLAFSMDMGRRQLWNRYFSQTADVPVKELERGQHLDEKVVENLRQAKDTLVKLPFWVDPHPYRTLSEIRAIIRRSVLRHGIKVVFLDHIGKIRPEKSETRQEEVSKIAQGLKAIAKEFSITIVTLVQLNRMVEQRADKRPMMSDLRESGAIEQEADIILLAYRPEYYEMETFASGASAVGKVEIIGAKVRNGESGSRVLDFEGEYTRILEKQPVVYSNGSMQNHLPPFAAAFGL